MAQLSNLIEEFLNQLLDQNEGVVELRRNELANDFKCSPSQINYVLETRFQPQMGYYIESRRGGGGYIKIERVELNVSESLTEMILSSIGDSITLSESDLLLNSLVLSDAISENEEKIIKAAIEDRALEVKGVNKKVLRASILRNILLALLKEI